MKIWYENLNKSIVVRFKMDKCDDGQIPHGKCLALWILLHLFFNEKPNYNLRKQLDAQIFSLIKPSNHISLCMYVYFKKVAFEINSNNVTKHHY